MDVSMSELRHRISIRRPVTDTDDEGNILSSSVQEVGKVWALVLPFAAKISDGYAEKVQEVDYRIVIRYRADVRVTDLVQWNGLHRIIVSDFPSMTGCICCCQAMEILWGAPANAARPSITRRMS